MSQSNADVFDSLSKGDLIQFDGKGATKNPHEVMADEPSGGFLSVKGPGGADKMLMQNKHDDDLIYIMSMTNINDRGTKVKNLRKVGGDS